MVEKSLVSRHEAKIREMETKMEFEKTQVKRLEVRAVRGAEGHSGGGVLVFAWRPTQCVWGGATFWGANENHFLKMIDSHYLHPPLLYHASFSPSVLGSASHNLLLARTVSISELVRTSALFVIGLAHILFTPQYNLLFCQFQITFCDKRLREG